MKSDEIDRMMEIKKKRSNGPNRMMEIKKMRSDKTFTNPSLPYFESLFSWNISQHLLNVLFIFSSQLLND